MPAGGGGLIGGIGLAAHGVDPDLVVYGAQSEASPALHAAQQAGRLVPVEIKDSLADGLAGNVEHDSITFDLVQQHVASIALVSEPDIAQAMRLLLEHEHVLVEGSAAVGSAAVRRALLAARPERTDRPDSDRPQRLGQRAATIRLRLLTDGGPRQAYGPVRVPRVRGCARSLPGA